MTEVLEFTIPYLTPGLNGSDGLLRQHFRFRKLAKTKLVVLLLSQRTPGNDPLKGPLRVEYIRFCHQLMDWDNVGASFKNIGDALTNAGIIIDDNPKVVRDLVNVQKQIPKKEKERIVIRITAGFDAEMEYKNRCILID